MKIRSLFAFLILSFYSATVFSQISAGGLHSFSLCSDSTIMTWGYNFNGQLGLGDTTDRHSPVKVNSLSSVIAVSTGGNPLSGVSHSLALKSDGTVWTCGWNHYGQLGTGDTLSKNIFVQVSGLTNIKAIGGGGYHSFALKNDGTVWIWGRNKNGQLGLGDTIERNSPVQVSALMGIVAITAGWGNTIALKNDGTVWSWGQNFYGQLGLGDTSDRHIPVQVSGLTGIIAIAGGGGHSLALKNDGTVWAWGYNSLSQMGDSTTIDRHSPVQVHGPGNVGFLAGIIAIAAGAGHSLALKNDGTVWSWGFNQLGQLGDSTTADKNIPVKVIGITGITAVSAGGGHSLALKNDTTLWAWGYNNQGQLGDGTTNERSAPIKVIGLCQGSSGVNEIAEQLPVSVFPNPFYDQTTFTYDGKLKNASLKIYDISGKEVMRSLIPNGTNNFIIHRGNLLSGIYFYQIILPAGQAGSETKRVASGKLIVE